MIAPSPLAILEQALAWHDQGQATALVTLVGIAGSSSRALGTQMAVAASGGSLGSFSGGCIDDAIAADALAAIERSSGTTVRFGQGSPYIDLRLPCGGGIDLLFTPRPSLQLLREAVAELRQRRRVELRIAEHGLTRDGPGYRLGLVPPLRITAFGAGEDFAAFLRLAQVYGAECLGHTPDAELAAQLNAEGLCVVHLATLGQLLPLVGDPWTAFVFLFHDRDWEDALLPRVLALPALFCGAVGSPRTHALRLERLRTAGCSEAWLSKLRGPIGLIAATRDPATLAISALAEVAGVYSAAVNAEPRIKAPAPAG